ncbi:SH3 domain-containing protein [Neobacillus drentensis]|uniref:SH3 domain-containing protein n=1 Tax=Neobacillus drentensis TaxID=220684 RepID=UPI003000FC02
MKLVKKVEIRKGVTSSYPIIKSLNSGQQVKVIDEFTNSTGQKWFRVDLGSAKGWGIATQFSISQTPVQKTVLTRTDIRKGATTSYASIGTVSPNQKVDILDTFTNSKNEKW